MQVAGFLLIIGATGCSEYFENTFPNPPSHAVSYITDDSREGLKRISSQEFNSLIPIRDQNLYDGFTIRMRSIHEAEKEIFQVQVQSEHWIFSNENNRVATLKALRNKVTMMIDSIEKAPSANAPKSRVYETIASEAQYLNSTNARDKQMVINSDLLENTDQFSFYRSKDFLLAQNSPEQAVKELEQIAPMPSLKGVVILIVFQPPNYETQKQFDVAAQTFKLLFEKHGAEVSILPNITAGYE